MKRPRAKKADNLGQREYCCDAAKCESEFRHVDSGLANEIAFSR